MLKKRVILYAIFPRKEEKLLLLKVWLNSYKILINNKLKRNIILNNPKTHFEYENAYAFQFNDILITWDFGNKIPIISVYIKEHNLNPLKSLINRFFSIQYTLESQNAGQILHELVLVPLTYIFNDIAPIHCSSFVSNDRSFLLGGTGGIGKTSTLIEFGKKEDISFMADDITIISKDGYSYPNFAYPKIYAYNTIGNPNLEHIILKNDGFIGKLQWMVKKRKNPAGVRRRIPPNILYNIPEKDRYEIDTYIIISRGNYQDLTYEKTNYEKMVEMTLDIMICEYWFLNNQYYWHQYNSYLQDKLPLIDLGTVFQNWKSIYLNTFRNSSNYIFKVPYGMENKAFKEKMNKILTEEIC